MTSAIVKIPIQKSSKVPERGDVFYADLSGIEQTIGSEQTGRRPVVVLQNDVGNKHSPTTIVAIITTKIKRNLPTHVVVNRLDILTSKSAICVEQIKTIDKTRLEDYKGNVGESIMRQVDAAIEISLGMGKKNNGILNEKSYDREKEGDIMVKKSVIFDDQEQDWIKIAEQQLEFFTNIKQYIINLKCDKEQLESDIEEILDCIENTHYNVAQGYKIYKMLRERRIQRKEKVNEIEMLEALLENFDCESMRKSYQSGLAKMQNTVKEAHSSDILKEMFEVAV